MKTKDPEKAFAMARILYVRVLRPLVYNKIIESPSKVDDYILLLLDEIFDVTDGELDIKK